MTLGSSPAISAHLSAGFSVGLPFLYIRELPSYTQPELFLLWNLLFNSRGYWDMLKLDVVQHQSYVNSKPRICTFFKDAEINIGSTRESDIVSLSKLKKKLGELRHFYTSYENIGHLKRQFGHQLDKILEEENASTRI